MADFAVAHLARWQADAEARGLEERARAASPERVPDRGVGECDCVAVSFRAVAPSIEYDERDWPRALCSGHYMSNVILPRERARRVTMEIFRPKKETGPETRRSPTRA